MTKLNLALTVLLILGVVLPGVALASGIVSDFGFSGVMAKIIPAMALFLLLNNVVALVAKKR
jgi:hypothetical protein